MTDEQFYKLVGKRMARLRKDKGFKSYEDFALEAGIPRAQYGRYEAGSDLKLSSLRKVLKTLDISIQDFFSVGFE